MIITTITTKDYIFIILNTNYLDQRTKLYRESQPSENLEPKGTEPRSFNSRQLSLFRSLLPSE